MSSLDAQSEARKKRLAQLKSLKRKNESSDDQMPTPTTTDSNEAQDRSIAERGIKLSGRNFDVEERVPKMGFLHAPNEGQETIELKAEAIVEAVKAQQAAEESGDKPIDLFNLQPKKPNWDLKRDVDKKLERLKPRTKSAIAKLVRERINSAKSKSLQDGNSVSGDDAANSAVEGRLAELVKEREREMDVDEDL